MQIHGSTALVTGANRGIGRHFAQQLLERGATKVYAAARNPESVDLPGVEALRLDITDPASVAAAAATASDVTVLVNNAGISTLANLVNGDEALIRQDMETNYFGTLNMVRAFAPVLAAGGGGAILNILSGAAWRSPGMLADSYAASKAASWSLTNGVRLELAAQGTQVSGLFVGMVDTDMTAGFDVPKADPAAVARAGLDGIESGSLEVLADQATVDLKAAMSADPALLYPELAGE
ncbi:SDR family oxidoreductase [Glycomyces sp. TRM65418]|uniref:SDR family oxidoreductase n=1 Tax=Glycomyces sp. TRM65418 TaxID=2867006 RepID=UPI001CE6CC83|nr:SDR family oxidoreductase [Glycomyces sp. TRM65418]MCC3764066.1 SDR family oxidoreductase [Glycomyces sp. TRM65418]QZD53756.1 SDR family oxidoreductase [Glycomyces sp. TRM65418]